MSGSILIVDDEQDLVSTLEYNLKREGFRTRSAFTGRDALRLLADGTPVDLVVLDLMLPDISGTEVCRTLRTQGHTRDVPVLMLTARGEEIDRVVGLEMGADDYVTKPFSVRELILRIRAVLRRAQPSAEGDGSEAMAFGTLRVDPVAHRVWVDENDIKLTALEFRLLTTFLERKGRVQTRDTLLSDVWGINAEVTTRTVDTHVKRLR
ncbi:MAG TPA: response regulator transcription factor, partial [Myxococcota bacterium]|nr:response regulator transcription factor [Myxococcota bacterium]